MRETELADKLREDIPMQAATNDNQCSRPPDDYVIREMFTYHPPSPWQNKSYEAVRQAARHLAEVVLTNVPKGADRTTAIRKIREAVMTANAGIALDGLSL